MGTTGSTSFVSVMKFTTFCFCLCWRVVFVHGGESLSHAHRHGHGHDHDSTESEANKAQGVKGMNSNLKYSYMDQVIGENVTFHTDVFTNIPASGIPSSIVIADCNAFINSFGELASKFTKCTVRNARPLTFCQHCEHEYTKAADIYNQIVEGNLLDKHGTKCREMILNADTVKLVQRTKQYMDDLWYKCRCDGCFDLSKDGNGSTHRNMSMSTVHFLSLINKTSECFRNYSRGFIVPIDNTSSANATVCEHCKKIYKELNEFYHKLEKENHAGICMDIVDAMNFTRILWSRDFRCHQKKHDTLVVVLVSSIFCLLPILFYAVSRLHGAKLEAKILQEKRMKNSDSKQAGDNQEDGPSTSASTSNYQQPADPS